MNSELTRALAGGRVQRTRWLDGCVYDVHGGHSVRAQPLSWRALPLPPRQDKSKDKYPLGPNSSEARALRSLSNPHLIKHVRFLTVDPGAMYVLTEILPERTVSQLLNTATSEGLLFREGFLWNALHQMSSACKALQGLRLQFFDVRFHPDHVYVDNDSNIKVDPFYVPTLQILSKAAYISCQNNVCAVGSLINYLVSETKQSFENFQCVIKELLHETNPSRTCNILPDIILHHPIVLSYLDNSTEIFLESPNASKQANDSAFESDDSTIKIDLSLPSIKSPDSGKTESYASTSKSVDFNQKLLINEIDDLHLSPTLSALDLKIPGYVPRKPDRAKKWQSRWELGKEPKEVSEETLNRVWIERLADIRKREEAIKIKEIEMAKKDIFDKIRSEIKESEINETIKPPNIHDDSFECVPGITLQSVMTAKNFHNIDNADSSRRESLLSDTKCFDGSIQSRPLPKRPYSRTYSLRAKNRKKPTQTYDDMDSSLSADPGDTSILPTSKKLSATIVPRPSMIENLARKKVHFNSRNNPFAEYESISSTTLTFFDIEDMDPTYEIPRKAPVKTPENISDRIAKFSYFDLEAITNKKRAQMEEWRRTPPKPKPSIKSNLSLLRNNNVSNIDMNMKPPDLATTRKSRRQKYISPKYSSTCNVNYNSSQSETSYKSTKSLPCVTKMDCKRKSISSVLSKKHNSEENISSPVLTNASNVKQKLNARASFYCIRSHFEGKSSTNVDQNKKADKENLQTPVSKKRKSILGFKTPFRFKI